MRPLPNLPKPVFRSALLALAGALLWGAAGAEDIAEEAGADDAPGVALVISIDDAIGVATAEFFISSLKTAQEREASILVLELDTPGGLLEPMRDMIKEILASDVPVAVYVTPNGARAASAGTYILYASHVAAMSKATTLGAATPVSMGHAGMAGLRPGAPVLLRAAESNGESEPGNADAESSPDADQESAADDGGEDEGGEDAESAQDPNAEAAQRKMINDSVSYIRSLARQRGRNADWAEEAVREGATLEAIEAVEMNVADFIADGVKDLLEKADGREVDLDGATIKLNTAEAEIERLEPGWRTRLLSILTNPSVAYLLVIVGLYGLLLEGYNPGSLVPGIVGVICLLLAAYALSVLPVNYAGLALMVLGVGLIIAESLTPSFGVLGLGGVAAFVVGSIILFDTGIPGFEAPVALIAGVGLAAGLLMLGLVAVLARSQRRPVVSGRESLVGRRAVALEDFEDTGPVLVQGERWQASASSAVTSGQELYVHSADMDRLKLVIGHSPPVRHPRRNLFTLLRKTG
ncbi:MAG: nodulation protein NfeD [Gammaproteobacteria bacterium]|nr:nodulation protein NfeD [Gammaproteobacteria bacterium]MCY4165016.1 nodulation protein NfeD [Gammaproteobacteria bacterium]MCY4340242.1 nodulation protein NfeD [Gammaproteobacteria bacterium]